MQGGGNGELIFPDPELFVSPGWPLPDFWLPVSPPIRIYEYEFMYMYM